MCDTAGKASSVREGVSGFPALAEELLEHSAFWLSTPKRRAFKIRVLYSLAPQTRLLHFMHSITSCAILAYLC